jgi:hypothetical protein
MTNLLAGGQARSVCKSAASGASLQKYISPATINHGFSPRFSERTNANGIFNNRGVSA